MAIDSLTRRRVRLRAGEQCEYCRCHQDQLPFVSFHIEHIIAKQHGGSDDESNLCLACHWCNFHKGTNIATHVDGHLVPLFDPRQQSWNDHFEYQADLIAGRTPVGLGTVRLLDMNDDERRELRRMR
jgi:hypothetical protein